MPQYVLMLSGGIVYGPVTTLAAAKQHAYVRAYNDAMDVTVATISEERLAQVIAEFQANITIHEITLSPALTEEGK